MLVTQQMYANKIFRMSVVRLSVQEQLWSGQRKIPEKHLGSSRFKIQTKALGKLYWTTVRYSRWSFIYRGDDRWRELDCAVADWSLRPRTDHQNAVLTLLLRVAKIAQQAVDRQHSAVQNKNEKTHHYNPSPGTSR